MKKHQINRRKFLGTGMAAAAAMGVNQSFASNETYKPIPVKKKDDNPFNPVTTIKFSLPERSNVNLAVYDILGNKVEQLIQKEKTAGIHSVDFNSKNLSSGVYFYTLKTSAGYSAAKKALILK